MMARNVGADTSGNIGDHDYLGPAPMRIIGPKQPQVLGGRTLFKKRNPGSPGKLGRTSTTAESLSKLRGKGALA